MLIVDGVDANIFISLRLVTRHLSIISKLHVKHVKVSITSFVPPSCEFSRVNTKRMNYRQAPQRLATLVLRA